MTSIRNIRRNKVRKMAKEEGMPLKLAWKLMTGQSTFEEPLVAPKPKNAEKKKKHKQKLRKKSKKRNRS